MRLLLHICCGPCATALVEALRAEEYEVTGFFYNPNIYPIEEHERRKEALREFSRRAALPVIWGEEDGLPVYLKKVAFAARNRCFHCYGLRLRKTAEQAASQGFDLFTTTLLISPYQNLERLNRAGLVAARRHRVPFLFRDFRPCYRRSREQSRSLGLYRQSYCGCFFSQLDRARAEAGAAEPGPRHTVASGR